LTIDNKVVAQSVTNITNSFTSPSPLLASNQPASSLVVLDPTIPTSPAPKAGGIVFTKTIEVAKPSFTLDPAAVEKVLAAIANASGSTVAPSPVVPSPVVNDATIPAGTSFSQADVFVSNEPGNERASISVSLQTTGTAEASFIGSAVTTNGNPMQGVPPAIGADIVLSGAANGQTDQQVISFGQEGFASANFAPQISLPNVTPINLAGLASQTAPIVEVL
jgi:hypothetical protein